jgi:hypothetical protein
MKLFLFLYFAMLSQFHILENVNFENVCKLATRNDADGTHRGPFHHWKTGIEGNHEANLRTDDLSTVNPI